MGEGCEDVAADARFICAAVRNALERARVEDGRPPSGPAAPSLYAQPDQLRNKFCAVALCGDASQRTQVVMTVLLAA